MADNTPQKMIDAEKRKLQSQAFSPDPFMREMEEAESTGNLPPADVKKSRDDATRVVQGFEGGETPKEVAMRLQSQINTTDSNIMRVQNKVRSVMSRLPGLSNYDTQRLIKLAGEGKIQFPDQEAQKSALDAYSDSMNTFGNDSFGIEMRDGLDERALRDLQLEFPEAKASVVRK